MKALNFLKEYKTIEVNLSIETENIKMLERRVKAVKENIYSQEAFYNYLNNQLKEKQSKATEYKARLDHIENIVDRLENDKYRTLIYCRFIKGYEWEQVTDELSIGRKERYTPKNVMGYMKNKALEEVQKILDQEAENI